MTPSLDQPTPLSRRERRTLIVTLVVLALLAAVLLSGSHESSNSGCEQVWATHVDNARRFGYDPGSHSAFVAQCEQGHSDLGGP